MIPILTVHPQGPLGRWMDVTFESVMRHISGAAEEAPQRTHVWNNHHLTEGALAHLNTEWMISHSGDPTARNIPSVPIVGGASAHLTRYGGWKHYLVLKSEVTSPWYVGWRWSGGGGVSRIPTVDYKRVLVGPKATEWFGIDARTNVQIPISQVAEGWIGDRGEFSQIPLF